MTKLLSREKNTIVIETDPKTIVDELTVAGTYSFRPLAVTLEANSEETRAIFWFFYMGSGFPQGELVLSQRRPVPESVVLV